jgi:arsenate reductase
MPKWTIYYNPKCSKCREALELLQSKNIEPTVIEYLKDPPSEAELKKIAAMLSEPAELVRTKEDDYQANKFDLTSAQEIAKHLAKNPKLIERPVVIKDNQAVVARPVEKLKSLL